MTDRIAELSHNRIAKIAGTAWLLIIVTGVFAEFVVRSSLIVSDDVAETARKIMESESLFRIGIASDILMVGLDVVVAVALFALFKPVSRTLSLLAASFRMVQASILAVNVLNLFVALELLNGADHLGAFEPDQLHALASSFLEAHAIGYSVGLVFFSLSTATLSYLLFKSKSVHWVFVSMLAIASVIYMAGSFVHILAPEFVDEFEIAYLLPFLAETSLALHFVIKGVRVRTNGRRDVAAIATPA